MQVDEVTVATFDSQTRAFLVVDTLKAEGIPSARVPLDSDGEATGSTEIRRFEVRVRSEDAELAKQILAELRAA